MCTGRASSWAWTIALTPPTWSTWPWVLRRATRRRPCCSRRARMLPGSGGASMSTHSPPGPAGATNHALVAAIQRGNPSISTGSTLPAAVQRLCYSVGERMLLELFERYWQGQAPVGPLARGPWHVRAFDHGHGVVERARHQQRRRAGQGSVGADDDLCDVGVGRDAREATQVLADLLPAVSVGLQSRLLLRIEVATAPKASDGREVVCGDGRHRQLGVPVRLLLFEPPQSTREE